EEVARKSGGEERNARWGREQLSRHRLADVPDLEIDSGPEYNAGIARQFERRAVDDRRVVGTFARNHRAGHKRLSFSTSFRGRRTRNVKHLTPSPPPATPPALRTWRYLSTTAQRLRGEPQRPAPTR